MCESVSTASGQISLHAIQFNMATKASALYSVLTWCYCTWYIAEAALILYCTTSIAAPYHAQHRHTVQLPDLLVWMLSSRGQCIASYPPSWIIAWQNIVILSCGHSCSPPVQLHGNVFYMYVKKMSLRPFLGLGRNKMLKIFFKRQMVIMQLGLVHWSPHHDSRQCLQHIGHVPIYRCNIYHTDVPIPIGRTRY